MGVSDFPSLSADRPSPASFSALVLSESVPKATGPRATMATGAPALSSATPLDGAQDAAAVPRAPALSALQLSRLLDEFEVESTVEAIEAGDFKRVRGRQEHELCAEAARLLFRFPTSCCTRRSRYSRRCGNGSRSLASSTSSPTRPTAGPSVSARGIADRAAAASTRSRPVMSMPTCSCTTATPA